MIINKEDYYFGGALSVFFANNTDSRPSLVEPGDNSSRSYLMMSNTSGAFYLYMKYNNSGRDNKTHTSFTWDFDFTRNEVELIQKHIDSGEKVYIALLCNRKDYDNKGIALLTQKEYQYCIAGKPRITIRLEKRDKRFRHHFVVLGGEKPREIRRNRIMGKITEIEDVV